VYHACELDNAADMCEEAIRVTERAHDDFVALRDRFRRQREFELGVQRVECGQIFFSIFFADFFINFFLIFKSPSLGIPYTHISQDDAGQLDASGGGPSPRSDTASDGGDPGGADAARTRRAPTAVAWDVRKSSPTGKLRIAEAVASSAIRRKNKKKKNPPSILVSDGVEPAPGAKKRCVDRMLIFFFFFFFFLE
jgi:hypothetical protein